MYFGRRFTALCAAVVVFTLETHDSSLGGPMPHPRTDCDNCAPEHAAGRTLVANARVRSAPYRVADAGWQNTHHPKGPESGHASQPRSGSETPPAGGSYGGYQFAAGGPGFWSGPGFSGGSDGGSGNSGNPGDHSGGDTNGGNPTSPPTGGDDGDNGGNGGGNGGGGPVVVVDPPPVYPPDGPVTPPVDPGGNTTDVPEPASLLIALAGLAGLVTMRRRQRAG